VPPVLAASAISPLGNISPTVSGQVSDVGSGVASLTEQVDAGPVVPVAFGSSGAFQFTTALALDGSADGLHTIHLRARDKAGNQAAPVDLTFTLDTRPPVLAISSPAPGLVTYQSPTIVGQVSDALSGVSSLVEQLDNGTSAPVPFDPSGNFRFAPGLPLGGSADGPHTVHFIATDRAGNVSTPLSFSFTLDTVGPVITITSPAQNLVTAQDPTILGQVSDATSQVGSLTAQLDNNQPVAVSPDSSGHFSFTPTLPLNGTADGLHRVIFAAVDTAGNITGPVDYTVTLATGASVLTITSPAQNLVTNQDPTIAGTVTGAATLTAQVDTGTPSMVTIGSGGAFSLALTLPTNGTADGPHSVKFVATASNGSMTAPVTYTFTLKTTPPATPTLTLDPAFVAPPPATANETTAATITLDGQTDPNTSVTLQPGNETATSDSSGKFTFTGVALALGANNFTDTATDAAGNQSSSSITITGAVSVSRERPRQRLGGEQ
jgi:hypothetical protein